MFSAFILEYPIKCITTVKIYNANKKYYTHLFSPKN